LPKPGRSRNKVGEEREKRAMKEVKRGKEGIRVLSKRERERGKEKERERERDVEVVIKIAAWRGASPSTSMGIHIGPNIPLHLHASVHTSVHSSTLLLHTSTLKISWLLGVEVPRGQHCPNTAVHSR
jgi:hypothetical protein